MSSAFSSPITGGSFNGTSQFAGSLQQEINQAVAIASIPLTGLQNNIVTLQNQQSALGTLEGDFTSLQTAIHNLSSASAGSFAATVGDNTIATATVDPTATVTAGSYNLNVINAGAPTLTLSNAGSTVTDPNSQSISTSGSFTLTVGSTNTTITPASNTLTSLAQAINSSGSGVTATIVNIGSSSSPDYRLSLQSTTLQDETIQLNDGSQNLLETLAHGANVQYQVDGQPASPASPISSTSSTITLAPGVTVQIQGTGDTSITVAPDSSASENALSAFVTAYNTAVADLGQNHGTAGGALTGQPIVFQLEQTLNSLVNYSGGSGSVTALSSLGISFNQNGTLTFNKSQFDSVQQNHPSDLAAFLGTPTGTGFLASATNALSALEDTSTGVFQSLNKNLQSQITQDNSQVNDDTARISNMQTTMIAQMSAADAAIAKLESQVTYFTNLFADAQNALNANH